MIFAALLTAALVGATPPIVITDADRDLDLTARISVLEDPEGVRTFGEVSQPALRATFAPTEGAAFGWSQSTYWLHAELDDRRTNRDPLYLVVENNLISKIELEAVSGKVISHHLAGYEHLAQADLHHRFPVFALASPGGRVELYLRAHAGAGTSNFPLRLMTGPALAQSAIHESLLFGAFFGLALLMLLYNGFVALSLRERPPALYAGWVCALAASMAVDHGLAQYFFPSLSAHTANLVGVTFAAGIGSSLLFGRSFLSTRTHTPRLDVFLRVCVACAVGYAGLQFISFNAAMALFPVLMLGTWTLAGIGIARWRKGDRAARFYVVAWLVFLVLATLTNVAGSGSTSRFFSYGVIAGSGFQMLLFSLALADRINLLNLDKLSVQQRMAQSFSRFVPQDFLRHLSLSHITDVKLGDQVQLEMSVLFTDIRSFTDRSERLSPRETFNFINGYLREVGPVIRRHHGFIDKYIGDAIMALFSTGADDAVRGAVGILEELEKVNARLTAQGVEPIRMGIGIHTGTLMLGIVGEEQRLEGTVISDAVNLASRVEGLSKHYGAQVVITQQTLEGCAGRGGFAHRPLGKVRVKGKQQAILLYEVYAADPAPTREAKHRSRGEFEAALTAFFEGRFAEAAGGFERVLAASTEDGAARFYRSRCAHYLEAGTPAGWDGAENFESK